MTTFGSKQHLESLRSIERSAGTRHDFTLAWPDGSVSTETIAGTKAQAFARLRQKLPRQAVRRGGRAIAVTYQGAPLSAGDRALLSRIRT